jgi:hypothetical protein
VARNTISNPAVSARAALAAKSSEPTQPLRKMVLDLENPDTTIFQIEPDFRVETIKPKSIPPAEGLGQPGQMTRDSSSASFVKPQSRLPVSDDGLFDDGL